MNRSSLAKHEKALKWEKQKAEKAMNKLIVENAEALMSVLIARGLEGDITAIDKALDRGFGKVRQNIGVDGGAEGAPILFMPAGLVEKYNLVSPQEEIEEALEDEEVVDKVIIHEISSGTRTDNK